MTHWTDTDDQILRKWHAQGLTDNAIADKMNCSPKAAHKHRRLLGLPANLARVAKRFTAAELSEVRQQYRNGSTTAAIAKRLGCSKETVRIAVLDISQSRQAERQTVNERIISLRTVEKLTAGQIAAKLHISRNAVIGVLHRNGIAAPGYYQPKQRNGLPGNRAKPNTPTVTRDPYKGEWPKGCQYPSGEGASLKWCDAPKEPGKPYCGYHGQVCHQPRPDKLTEILEADKRKWTHVQHILEVAE